MNLGHYLNLSDRSLLELGDAFSAVAAAHSDEPDVRIECEKFAKQTAQHRELLRPSLDRYQATDASDDESGAETSS